MSTGTDAESGGSEMCSVIDGLEQIGSQWRLVVLHTLQEGEMRFNELKRETTASSRTLSRVLDDLQEMGMVDRRLEEDAPVATYYSLTAKGESLCPVFESIEAWANDWVDVGSDADDGDDSDGGTDGSEDTADEPGAVAADD